MTKSEFISKFDEAAALCLEFTQSLVTDSLPRVLRFNFSLAHWLAANPAGTVKFIGGRLLHRDELLSLDGRRASQFLWVDGKIPSWINLRVEKYDADYTYIEIAFNPKSLTGDHARLMHAREGNPPFHVLGPQGGKVGEKVSFTPIHP